MRDLTLPVMSADLIWQLTRPWNCHHLRRTHPVRKSTLEKGSLAGALTFVDSGLANRKAVDVSVDEGVVAMALKNDKEEDLRKPDKMWASSDLTGGARKAIAKADRKLDMYRPAAKIYALRKVSALARAEQRAKAGIDHTKVKTGRKSSSA